MTATMRGRRGNTVNWSRYSQVYDLMAEHNPAYLEMRDLVLDACRRAAPFGGTVVDVGGGTGNISVALASTRQDLSIIHVEPDLGMRQAAEAKANSDRLSNWTSLPISALEWSAGARPVDLIVATHVLYTLPDPIQTLEQFHRAVAPGGCLITCDLGRVLDVRDWGRFIWRSNVRRCGYLRTARLFIQGAAVASENRRIAACQVSGRYWTHDMPSFLETLRKSGFTTESAASIYRGYSTFAVCRRTAVPAETSVPV